MDIFRIEGPVQLSGAVSINGSKNASLPIMAAAILAAGKSVIKAVPRLSDISVLVNCLANWVASLPEAQAGIYA
jgi:UDP-N-acetylglucosamine 1-carboxyvinyltransferase